MLGGTDTTGLIAQLAKMLLGNSAVLPLLRRRRSVGVPQLLEPSLHLEPSGDNLNFAFLASEPLGGLAQRLVERGALTVVKRAVLQFPMRQGRKKVRRRR